MARILSSDWVPRFEDAGYDAILTSLAPRGLEHKAFLEAVNASGSQAEMNMAMLMQYIIDRKASGELETISVYGEGFPAANRRTAAPTGLGGDIGGVWFSGPTENLGDEDTLVYWYVNGELIVSERMDIRSNRSAPAAVLAAASEGDVIQVCLVDDVVGWWARIGV